MLSNDLSSDLKDLENNKLYRHRKSIEEIQKQNIKINNRWALNFSSNDYLGLTQNKNIKSSIINGIKKYGNGSGSSHLISGHYFIHDEIEKLISSNLFFNKSILFTSGFAANLGVITSLCARNDVIFSDKLNHASLNEAALLSKSRFVRYKHLDLQHLEQLLKKYDGRRKLIISDAVFSMDGDLINLPELLDLCDKYDAYLYIDDAHGFGVLGRNGKGTLEHYYPKLDFSPNLKKRIIYMFTLGKSVGVSGAIVLASNYLVQFPIKYYGLEEILTYGAFSYPIAFLITDLANRSFGKSVARKIVYIGFTIGILFTLIFSTNFADLISIRIAIGSGTAFIIAQLLDVQIFDQLRQKKWFIAPLTSSLIGSTVDTFLFFSISFYATGVPWVTLSLGDLAVKIFIALVMLIPFRLLLGTLKAVKA